MISPLIDLLKGIEDPSTVCKYHNDSATNYYKVHGTKRVQNAFTDLMSTCIFAYRQAIHADNKDFKKTLEDYGPNVFLWLKCLHKGNSLIFDTIYIIFFILIIDTILLFFYSSMDKEQRKPGTNKTSIGKSKAN